MHYTCDTSEKNQNILTWDPNRITASIWAALQKLKERYPNCITENPYKTTYEIIYKQGKELKDSQGKRIEIRDQNNEPTGYCATADKYLTFNYDKIKQQGDCTLEEVGVDEEDDYRAPGHYADTYRYNIASIYMGKGVNPQKKFKIKYNDYYQYKSPVVQRIVSEYEKAFDYIVSLCKCKKVSLKQSQTVIGGAKKQLGTTLNKQ